MGCPIYTIHWKNLIPKYLSFDASITHTTQTGGFTPRYLYTLSLTTKSFKDAKIRTSIRGQHLWTSPNPAKFTSKFGLGENVEYDSQGLEIVFPSMGVNTTIGFHTHLLGTVRNLPARTLFVIGMGFDFGNL
jgi:hypothetical protein